MIQLKNILSEQGTEQKLRVLFVGDSQTAMESISYAYKLLRTGVVEGRVVAKGGANTSTILKMLSSALAQDKYDVVVVMAGGNDSHRPSPKLATDNLSAMYKLAQQTGAKVIAISNPTKKYTKDPSKFPSNDDIANWAEQQNISDFSIPGNKLTDNASYFLKDRIHLNKSGQNLLFNRVSNLLNAISQGISLKNNDVTNTQAKLQSLGFDLGDEAAQGINGPKTKAAVEKLNSKFQQATVEKSWSEKALDLVSGVLSSKFVQNLLGNKAQPAKQTAETPLGTRVTPAQIVNFLKNKGLTTSQASGIAGNIQVESGFSTTAVGDGGTSHGLAQWHKDRYQKLLNWSNKNNVDPKSATAQLEFLWHELNTTESRALSQLKKQTNPRDAAYIFAKYFERPSSISSSRLKYAEDIYNDITKDVVNRLV